MRKQSEAALPPSARLARPPCTAPGQAPLPALAAPLLIRVGGVTVRVAEEFLWLRRGLPGPALFSEPRRPAGHDRNSEAVDLRAGIKHQESARAPEGAALGVEVRVGVGCLVVEAEAERS